MFATHLVLRSISVHCLSYSSAISVAGVWAAAVHVTMLSFFLTFHWLVTCLDTSCACKCTHAIPLCYNSCTCRDRFHTSMLFMLCMSVKLTTLKWYTITYFYVFCIYILLCLLIAHWWYPYFDIVVGLAWSHDPESYAVSNIATGMVFHLWQVKGDDPDKKGYPHPSGWGLGHEANNLTLKKPHCWKAI